MHNNILCLAPPTFAPTVFALDRKLFSLSVGLSIILCAAMSGLLKKAICFFLCSLKKMHENYHMNTALCVHLGSFLSCTLPRLVSEVVIYNWSQKIISGV